MKKSMRKANKNRKEGNLKNKGVTLISLIITIIVLLILAGVSINIVVDENGIFEKVEKTTMFSNLSWSHHGLQFFVNLGGC